MNYIFTTLAIGDSYLHNAASCYTKYSEKCSGDFNITTNEIVDVGPRVNLDQGIKNTIEWYLKNA